MKGIRMRRAAVAGVAIALLAGTTACSAINDQATKKPYAVSDGVTGTHDDVRLDDLRYNNLAVVSTDKNGSGRLIGTLVNLTDSDLDASLEVNGETLNFQVPTGDEGLRLDHIDDGSTIVNNHGSEPGRMADFTISAGGESVDVQVSVLAPGLKEYEEFAPEDFDPEELKQHRYEFEGHFAPEEDN